MSAFVARHLGPRPSDLARMLDVVGASSLDALIDETVPSAIRLRRELQLPAPRTEAALLAELEGIAAQNNPTKAMIGMGYFDVVVPGVIQRNILENPAWYTAYTPYQAEISQGRLEALLNYQTMISDLTGMEVANASLLDEGTAAAEALAMALRMRGDKAPKKVLVDKHSHPQTIAVIQGRLHPIDVEVIVDDAVAFADVGSVAACFVQNPRTDGAVVDLKPFCERVHGSGGVVVVGTDLMACALMTPPGEMGADVVIGSAQRFGVPMGYGGPHAAFMATKTAFVRSMPGRLIGLSQDATGAPALRMALQTREQHIRREKATSNVCTAQVLLAIMASMYAVWHGPDGLKGIASDIHRRARALADGLAGKGFTLKHDVFFDTVCVTTTKDKAIQGGVADVMEWAWSRARAAGYTLRNVDATTIGISVDETTSDDDIKALVDIFASVHKDVAATASSSTWPASLVRTSSFLTHPVFASGKSETEMLRYIRRLEEKDYSLVHGMIPLGSCTMKLNATTEMVPVTWRRFGGLHPFAPVDDAKGYQRVFSDLETGLAEITGFAAVSLQPNAGSQGELAGMLVIRAFHDSRGQSHRRICLIPQSAHGTNPASAVMAGLEVVVVACDEDGNIDMADLDKKIEAHKANLAAVMVTYPSTHGVFESSIKELCEKVHAAGGQVYMDGANMNAQVGLCRPGDIGADVCHLNLHKTFCIPHGGGGPGMGPIGVAAHLAPFLPGHPVVTTGGSQAIPPISAAPWGSASILLISWAYLHLMGGIGLREATKFAILSANYIAARLKDAFPVLYAGKNGRVAHECILDVRQLKASSGVEAEDVAKRLMDYGFHAPTLSFPVAGTLMVEPTESEPLAELDRFCDAMLAIRAEIKAIEDGTLPRDHNPLKHAPHPQAVVIASTWDRPYSREQAVFPTAHTKKHKYWPTVARVNNVHGDRHLVCSCPPTSDWAT
jgi:glycine dehydrogenase